MSGDRAGTRRTSAGRDREEGRRATTRGAAGTAARCRSAGCGSARRPRRSTTRRCSTRPRSRAGSRPSTAPSSTSFDTETTSLDPMQARIVGVSLSIAPGRACYIPLDHRYAGAPDQLDRDGHARAPRAVARRSGEEEARPEPEVRPARARQRRPRAARRRARHAARIVRARVAQAARHGQPRVAPPERQDDRVRRRHRQGREPHPVRAGGASSARPNMRPRTPTSRCGCIARCIRAIAADAKLDFIYAQLELPVREVLFRMERNGILIDSQLLGRAEPRTGRARRRARAAGAPARRAAVQPRIAEAVWARSCSSG